MKTHPQVAPNAAGYQTYDNSTVAGKANTNDLPSFSSKNGQPTAANMTPSSLRNSAGVQRCPSCTQEPRLTPQVSPNTSQQNFYNMPPVHPPNHFPPPPYFSIPFPPPPIAPSNASNAHSAPVSDISAVLTLMTNAIMQGNSNTTAITNALERTTKQFADALQQTIQMGVDAQAQENKNARMDKQFEKVKVYNNNNNNLFNVYTYSDRPYILIFNFIILYNTHIYVRVTLSQRAVSETDRVPFIFTILLALHLH